MNRENTEGNKVVGRFAPSPTGRMHLGNVFTALMSWLSVCVRGGRWILRIEDLDPQRSRRDYAEQIEDDLAWLGLDFDEGGLADAGPSAPYSQSARGDIYAEYLRRLQSTGMTYACTCRRADLRVASAPHASDGRVLYTGRCRPQSLPTPFAAPVEPYAVRLAVPDRDITVADGVQPAARFNLARECGDFVLRRADGAWAYQLAVVVDDALMGATEVVRGADLMLSAAQQIYLYELLGLTPPAFAHVPLLCNSAGQRLSKRDSSMAMDELRRHYSPAELTGVLAWIGGLILTPDPISPADLARDVPAPLEALRKRQTIVIPDRILSHSGAKGS